MACKKKYNPQEPVAITLTREQWQTVQHWLQYGTDYNMAKRMECWGNVKDKRMAAEMIAQHERGAAAAETVWKIIEETLCPAPEPETE